jgi:hypothetical protein
VVPGNPIEGRELPGVSITEIVADRSAQPVEPILPMDRRASADYAVIIRPRLPRRNRDAVL